MDRLEHADSYLTGFHAVVTDVREAEGATGRAVWVALDRSAFYPESGGQPADTGTLRGLPVTDVQIRDGRVWHRVEGGPLAPGDAVSGEIDWHRRFRHMQRHTGQHLLSQAFLHVDGAFETRSVSLTSADCTLDLAGEPDEHALEAAERIANDAVYANLPVEAFEVDESEIDRFPLRRPPKVRGRIRLVKMGEFELSACGGTHLASTAEAAPVKVLAPERIRGGLTRVGFRVGLEALEDYRVKHRVAHGLAREFSTGVPGLPERVEGLRATLSAAEQELARVRGALAQRMAEQMRSEGLDRGGYVVATHMFPEADQALARTVVEACTSLPAMLAIVGVELAEKAVVIVGRSSDLDLDVRPVLNEALDALGGRGGGRPELAQGGGPYVERLGEALKRARDAAP